MRTENMTRMTPDHRYTWKRCLVGCVWYGVTRVSMRKADPRRPSVDELVIACEQNFDYTDR